MYSQGSHPQLFSIALTHWGRVTHKCVGNLNIISADNGLSPGWCQAITWPNSDSISIPNWTIGNILLQWNFNWNSNILIEENAFENGGCKMAAISSWPQCVMLGLHRTPEGHGTDLRQKKWPNSQYLGSWSARTYVPPMLLASYSWLLSITWACSPLKSTSSTIAFNRQNQSWNLSISLASDPTRSWILLWSQVFCRLVVIHSMASSFGMVVNWSQVTLEIFISCKLLPSHTGNLRQSHPSHSSVVNWLQSITGQSEVVRKCITAVGPWMWFWCQNSCR